MSNHGKPLGFPIYLYRGLIGKLIKDFARDGKYRVSRYAFQNEAVLPGLLHNLGEIKWAQLSRQVS